MAARGYESLDPQFVLKRVQTAFAPPPTINFAIDGDRIVAVGSASLAWIQRARASSRMLPAGAPSVDLSQVRDINEGDSASCERRSNQVSCLDLLLRG